MNRKSRVFGIALIAALALSAVVAQGALAKFSFTAPERGVTDTTFLTGEKTSNHVFTTTEGEVTCTTISFSGSAVGKSTSEVSIAPSYSGCTAFGFATAHVKVNGCTYLFTTPTIANSPNPGDYTGESPHVKCPAGKSIEITPTFFGASVCTSKIGEQTPTSGHVIYTNAGGATTTMDVNVNATVEGIHYIGTGGVCGPNGVTSTDGKYTGSVTLKGYKNAAHTEQTAVTVD
jgi:hypothetical protein